MSFANLFQQAVSNARMTNYIVSGKSISSEDISRYLWNIKLCEGLYSCLSLYEITLRNNFRNAAVNQLGSEVWDSGLLEPRELETVAVAKKPFAGSGSPDSIVANLSFGFWVSLFRGQYEQKLKLNRLLPLIFPNAPRKELKRASIYRRLDNARRLRNRVFHYEPIWQWQNLCQLHAEILLTLGWMNVAALKVAEVVDEFPSIWSGGEGAFLEEGLRLMNE